MIVYNVARKWFTEKVPAEKYRVSLGLKPGATLAIKVEDRDGLAALLNALCEPPAPGKPVPPPLPALIDRAFVPVDRDVPDYIPAFLKKDWSVS